jgi:hypothetical protein
LTADIRAVFSGHGLEFVRGDVGPGQQVVDLAVGVGVDDSGEHVGKIAARLDAVELASFDQRGDDGPMLGAAVRTGEERVLAIERDRSDGALDHVAVDLDAAVVEEAGQAFPARERVADRLSELGLLADEGWRYDRKLGARLRFAKLRHQAAPEDIDYRSDRGLDRTLFLKLIAGDWIDAHDNLAICGPSGVGKSWLACALGHKACRDDRSVLYQRVPRLFANLEQISISLGHIRKT